MALLWLTALAIEAYTTYGALWRLYLSPIAHISGPRLAALTSWCEFYYNVLLGGQYTFKIIELHKKYGSIIRSSPWEVYVGDPDYHPTSYAIRASGERRDKYSWFTKTLGLDSSVSGTWEHNLHKLRRGALGIFFCMTNVRMLEGMIWERVHALMERFDEFKESGDVMMMSWAFAPFANDIVTNYSIGRFENRVEAPDIDPSFFGSTASNTMKHMPWMNEVLLQAQPRSLASILHSALSTHGVSCRLARSCPDEHMSYSNPATEKTWLIPRGTPSGMTSVQIHHNEDIFPNSKLFSPERWLKSASQKLDKYLVSLTSGLRQRLAGTWPLRSCAFH